MRKSILISYQAMMMGGSTTSLLGLLFSLDYNKYEVDLLLNTNTGEYLDKIPPQVNLLPPAFKYPNHIIRKLHSILSPKFLKTYFKAKKITKASGITMHGVQYLESQDVIKYRKIDKEYDVAIAFIEGMNCKFVAKHIKAKKKIAWVHIDYIDSKFDPQYDLEAMGKFQHIVTVSSLCKESLVESFPTLKDRIHSIENILSYENISNLAQQYIDFELNRNYINLVTTCRIEFSAKALDRAVLIWSKMKKERNIDMNKLKWFIIGDGVDFEKLKDLIKKENLENDIILLGKKTNPYPYLKKMDLFFLPSRFEGKPMAVTEGLMLGLPSLVTNYSSANEQVKNHFDGLVVDNNEEGIRFGLSYILNNQEEVNNWKKNINPLNYVENNVILQVENLIDN